jgi:glycogen debranching enzyme
MRAERPRADVIVGEHYYILASDVAGDLPKLVLKHDDAFLVTDRRGDLPNVPRSEFGFYVDGTRFLWQCELRVHEQRPLVLNAGVSEDALQLAIDLTNVDVPLTSQIVLPGRAMRIARRLVLFRRRLYQSLRMETFAQDRHELTLTVHLAVDYADVFEVRGHPRPRRGTLVAPHVEPDRVRFAYRGLDDVMRTTDVVFDPPPRRLEAGVAEYAVALTPGTPVDISIVTTAAVGEETHSRPLVFEEAVRRRHAVVAGLEHEAAGITTNHDLFNHWVTRSRQDLHLLCTDTADGFVPYAGIPWYVASFGRDALITALQLLPFEPEIARSVLGYLARYVGTRDDDFTDQEPGKILHEYRRGEMAACREIPFIPYYGTVDASPLFVMLLAEYLRWTDDREGAQDLWPTVEKVLDWMLASADAGATGYLRYIRRSSFGLVNQGWKDSQDSVMHVSGHLAEPPIALAEVQGYLYAALREAADVAEFLGRPERVSALRQRARHLRQRVEADFWMPAEGFYALALDRDGQPCRVISSNPGHLLWTGLPDEAHAELVARRLMAPDMFSGWGLRTLASGERLYNPMSYHNGSVWPHDTAIAVAGLRRYRLNTPAIALSTALFEAALQFETMRMPELFCGFQRVPGYGPTRYPVACSPQAWAAGVVFHLISSLLGLAPSAAANQITLNRPLLPSWLTWVELRDLRIGKSRLSVRVSQGRDGAAVELLAREGDTELVVRR